MKLEKRADRKLAPFAGRGNHAFLKSQPYTFDHAPKACETGMTQWNALWAPGLVQ